MTHFTCFLLFAGYNLFFAGYNLSRMPWPTRTFNYTNTRNGHTEPQGSMTKFQRHMPFISRV